MNNQNKADNSEKANFWTAFRLTGEAKLVGIRSFIEDLIEQQTKFMIFAHH